MGNFNIIILLFFMIMPVFSGVAARKESSKTYIYIGRIRGENGKSPYLERIINNIIKNRVRKYKQVNIYTFKTALESAFKNTEKLEKTDRVDLITIKRKTGIDGIIYGQFKENNGAIYLVLKACDLNGGTFFGKTIIKGVLNSTFLSKVEHFAARFTRSVRMYYKSIIQINTDPAGVDVYLDGALKGKSPCRLETTEGSHEIKLVKKQHRNYRRTIFLKKGEKATVFARMYNTFADYYLHRGSKLTLDTINGTMAYSLLLLDDAPYTIKSLSFFSLTGSIKSTPFSMYLRLLLGGSSGRGSLITFNGLDEGSYSASITAVSLQLGLRYNLLERLNSYEFYLQGSGGFVQLPAADDSSTDIAAKSDVYNLAWQAGLGFTLYLHRNFSLNFEGGYMHMGKIEYPVKETNYWGQASYGYQKKSLGGFYFQFGIRISGWPNLTQY